MIELSQIRGKEELIEKIEQRRQAAAEAAGNVQQLETHGMQLDMAKTAADTKLIEQSAIQKNIENAILVNQPDESPQVNT